MSRWKKPYSTLPHLYCSSRKSHGHSYHWYATPCLVPSSGKHASVDYPHIESDYKHMPVLPYRRHSNAPGKTYQRHRCYRSLHTEGIPSLLDPSYCRYKKVPDPHYPQDCRLPVSPVLYGQNSRYRQYH